MKGMSQKAWASLLFLLLPLLCSASPSWAQEFSKLATDVAAKIHAVGHTRVTVVDFVDLDRKTNKLGKFLANQLQSDLAEPALKLVVVDQSQLPQLLEQMEKLDEGLLDQATGQKLGKMLGTEVLIVGTVIPSSAWVRLDIKAIDLQTAKLITGGSSKVTRLTSALIDRLASEASGEEPQVSRSGSDSGTGTQTAAASKASSRPPARSRVDQGVAFELDVCSLNGEELSCDVTVTSENRDRSISVGFDSRAWTVAGEEHGPREVTIANSTADRSCAVKQILKNVPTHLAVTFPQFGDDASLVERLRLAWSENQYCYGPWRNVDFEKIELTAGASSRSARNGGGSQGGTKGNGSLMQGLQNKFLDILNKTIDNKTKKYTGDDGTNNTKPPL